MAYVAKLAVLKQAINSAVDCGYCFGYVREFAGEQLFESGEMVSKIERGVRMVSKRREDYIPIFRIKWSIRRRTIGVRVTFIRHGRFLSLNGDRSRLCKG